MTTIINGKVFHGNVAIVNGRIISGDSCEDSTSKKFDETKKESANGVNQITIDSDVNVTVSACNTNEVTAHLYGCVIMDSNLELCVTRISDEIQISVKSEESSTSYSNMSIFSGSSVIINNFSTGGLTLDIQIPARAFDKLSIKSKNANINLTSTVNANTIAVDNKNGNIDVSATFQVLNAECKNGNIDVDSEACCDVRLDVTSKNGNVDVYLSNIGTSRVSVDSKNGNCKNNPRLNGAFTASGYVTSKNGNAKFR